MAMKNNRNYIAQMNKGMKQKLSMLLIACLLFTGYHGLTISGRAEQEEKEQTNEISVSGTQVKVQLLGEDIRRAAKEAIEKGDRVEGAALQGYSGDEDLQKEYAEIFSSEKEVYEIPLDSISEGLSESLAEEEAGLQVFVERDAKDLERLVRKESKESLLLYDGNSQLSQLFPETKQEETKSAVEKKEESGAEEVHASDSNIEKPERNTELTGSELITFLYKNKADHRISFQLSVDGNTYPKVVVSPKTQLFKSFLDKLKKEEKKPQAETTVVASTEAKESTAAESTETEVTASSEETEESESESAASSVSLVSTEGSSEETTVLESTVVETAEAESAEESAETKEHTTEVTEETEATEETAAERKAAEAAKEKKENFTGFLQEVISHYEEFLGELETARFAQYSLNELGRKTQNVEIKDFVTVEVFYDEDAFDEDVVLEAKRLVKPEEEGEKEGEKLTKEQIKLMQESGIYDDTDSLDIRFVSKKNKEKEVEPKENYTVTVRLTFDKKAVPEEATADTIAIHHIVEKDGKEQYVETVLRSVEEKQSEIEDSEVKEVATEELSEEEHGKLEDGLVAEENSEKEEKKNEGIEIITKEFVVNSFSAYIVHWKGGDDALHKPIRFHFVDENNREIAPTIYKSYTWLANNERGRKDSDKIIYNRNNDTTSKFSSNLVGDLVKTHNNLQILDDRGNPRGYTFMGLFVQCDGRVKDVYDGRESKVYTDEVQEMTNKWVKLVKQQPNKKFFYDKREGNTSVCYHEFYLVYKMRGKTLRKIPYKFYQPNLVNDKYITKNSDKEYELTLTAQPVKAWPKDGPRYRRTTSKLDVLFVYDNTGNISKSDEDKIKENVYSLMDDISSPNSGFDAKFAFISMNREDNPSIEGGPFNDYTQDQKSHVFRMNDEIISGKKPIKGTIGDLSEDALSPNYIIADKPYDDLRTYAFSDSEAIKKEFEQATKGLKGPGTGANYAAAIRDAKSLMNFGGKKTNPDIHKDRDGNYVGDWGNFQVSDRYPNGSNEKTKNENLWWSHDTPPRNTLVRTDSHTVVVFITGGNPSKTYVPEDGIYENFVKHGDSYYLTRASYKKGQSIGNGDQLYYPALNDAKLQLRDFNYLDAFFAIGVGDKSNWNQLSEVMGVLPIGIDTQTFDASNTEKLENSFRKLRNEVTEMKVYNVAIGDKLSENVELVNGKNSLRGELVRKKANLVEDKEIIPTSQYSKLGLREINVGYDANSKTITLNTDPANFILPLGYEIRLVATVRPTKEAYTNIKKPNLVKGDSRTDLIDIYNEEKINHSMDPEKYGTSAKKLGLYTNDSAGVSYKYTQYVKYTNPLHNPKCSPYKEICEGERPYNKPIIKVDDTVYLRIDKKITGIDDKLIKDGALTELAKQVLKKISFEVYTRDGAEERRLTTINLGKDEWVGKDGRFKQDGYEIYIHGVKGKVNEGYTFGFTIYGMERNKEYKIKEIVEEGTIKAGNEGVIFKGKIEGNEGWNKISNDTSYGFVNNYIKDEGSKIVISKEVKDNLLTKPSAEDDKKVFSFYLTMYDSSDRAYDFPKILKFYNGLSGDLKQKITNIVDIPNPDNPEETVKAMYFTLQNGKSIEIPVDKNQKYRVFEKKEDGYDKAKVISTKVSDSNVETKLYEKSGISLSYTRIINVEEGTIKFINSKKIPPLTGLVKDLTPYLFSIFGFTLMAGAYFAINKKKRREI